MTMPPADRLPTHIAILGFARSGQALARALAQRGVAVSVGEAKSRAAFDGEPVGKLEADGVRFHGETFDTGVCHMAHFADPDGNVLMLHRRYAPHED